MWKINKYGPCDFQIVCSSSVALLIVSLFSRLYLHGLRYRNLIPTPNLLGLHLHSLLRKHIETYSIATETCNPKVRKSLLLHVYPQLKTSVEVRDVHLKPVWDEVAYYSVLPCICKTVHYKAYAKLCNFKVWNGVGGIKREGRGQDFLTPIPLNSPNSIPNLFT